MRTKNLLSPTDHLTGAGMSYKFQRLRERIRGSVVSGELSGKLPGERELARRFQVNAKTLSKALTDLAAEGLLQRSIGRGTFVRNSRDEEITAPGAWLLLQDSSTDPALVEHLKSINPLAESRTEISSIRPSVLSQFSAVVDLAAATPESFSRNLIVRGIPVVIVGREMSTYSVSGVMLDSMLGASQLTRQLVLGGHRHFVAVEGRARIIVADAIRRTAARYCEDYSVDSCAASDIEQAAEYGATACVCDSVNGAERAMEALNRAGIAIPEKMSVAAIGWGGDDCPCTGYFADPHLLAASVAEVLSHSQSGRPTSLWLTGLLVDRGTTSAIKVGTLAGDAGLKMVAAQTAIGIRA